PDVNLYESASDDVKQLVDGLLNIEEGSAPSMKFKLDENGQIIDESGKIVDVEEMTKQLETAQTDLTKAKTDLVEAQKTLATLTVEKTKVDYLLSESQEEVNRLTTENASLIEKAHKALAEKVVDMKIALRKSDGVGITREEAVE